MANGVLIVGPAGNGKTTGARNLNPRETFIINADRKPLPFKGWRSSYTTVKTSTGGTDLAISNYIENNNPIQIASILRHISDNRPDIRTVTIDTLNSIMTDQYMQNAKVTGFQKFTDLALNVYNLLRIIPELRTDLTVFVTGHTEDFTDMNGDTRTKLRTLGKMLDNVVNIESLFTIVLYTDVKTKDGVTDYGFSTQTTGANTCKSPMGMFDSVRIPNDYQYILDRIREYEN